MSVFLRHLLLRNFCDFPCAFLDTEALLERGLLLTLLHLERPKLHTILAFLSATGLNEKKNSRRRVPFVYQCNPKAMGLSIIP